MPGLEWIRPRDAVATDSQWWTALSNDPQFELRGWQAEAGRVVLLEVQVSTGDAQFRSAALYFDVGAGFSEADCVRFPGVGGVVQRILRLPPQLRKVRFDPVEKAGRFSIERCELRPLGFRELLARAWRRLKQTRGASRAVRIMAARGREFGVDRKAWEDWLVSVCAGEVEERWNRRYLQWIEAVERALLDNNNQAEPSPLVRIHVRGEGWSGESWRRMGESLLAQRYVNWEWVITPQQRQRFGLDLSDPRMRCEGKQSKPGADWTCWVEAPGALHPWALHGAMEAARTAPEAKMIYGDEDRMAGNGERYAPWFKCDCNEELLLAQDYWGALKLFRGDVSPTGVGYEHALRVIETYGCASVLHVPQVLFHRFGEWERSRKEARHGRRIVKEHLARRGVPAKVTPAPEAPFLRRIRYALPKARPLVSIIIPTRDRVDLLSMCLRALLDKSSYRPFEVLVINNGSEDKEALEYLQHLSAPVRVVCDTSPFNFAALNNRAAPLARGEVICLMNNDVEVITRGWLEEMVSLALRGDTGAVGARLWYPNGTLQHGGMILGMEAGSGHAHKHLMRGETGYEFRAVLRQEFSAVTGACMVFRKRLYEEVGGMDESLAIAFNDVDLCLRFRRAGYRNVWTPYAELIHHESATRGLDENPEKAARYREELRRMREKWPREMGIDPAYSPHLTRLREDFSMVEFEEVARYGQRPGWNLDQSPDPQ